MCDRDDRRFVVRAHVPGALTLTPAMLARLWERLAAENIAERLFYDGGVTCATGFAAFMTAPDVYCYAVYAAAGGADGGAGGGGEPEPVALAWLNNFSGRAAMVHFAVLRAGLPMKTAIGRIVVGFMLHGQTAGGGYCLDALYGMTPGSYVHVLRFIRRLGFRVQGAIPGAVALRRPEGGQRFEAGVLSVCTRESLGPLVL
ncbi:hypothetical protein [Desulfovibrio psychrotolerans]|uniref:GNAT family N-acetyltransferase n=1 Tax=Desulfovibrio psychrotolerans TaxID=415242 RepID=A0A7J0BTS5_9BACT|nr:hypothetical protein [Desulfovibrio psychrotolerans]GFM36591.1 hypothetical protein DSM19430T_12750 [Desulfovibrio psychrotolerans]